MLGVCFVCLSFCPPNLIWITCLLHCVIRDVWRFFILIFVEKIFKGHFTCNGLVYCYNVIVYLVRDSWSGAILGMSTKSPWGCHPPQMAVDYDFRLLKFPTFSDFVAGCRFKIFVSPR